MSRLLCRIAFGIIPDTAALEPFSQTARSRCFCHIFGADSRPRRPKCRVRPCASTRLLLRFALYSTFAFRFRGEFRVTSPILAGCHRPPYRLRSPATLIPFLAGCELHRLPPCPRFCSCSCGMGGSGVSAAACIPASPVRAAICFLWQMVKCAAPSLFPDKYRPFGRFSFSWWHLCYHHRLRLWCPAISRRGTSERQPVLRRRERVVLLTLHHPLSLHLPLHRSLPLHSSRASRGFLRCAGSDERHPINA